MIVLVYGCVLIYTYTYVCSLYVSSLYMILRCGNGCVLLEMLMEMCHKDEDTVCDKTRACLGVDMGMFNATFLSREVHGHKNECVHGRIVQHNLFLYRFLRILIYIYISCYLLSCKLIHLQLFFKITQRS